MQDDLTVAGQAGGTLRFAVDIGGTFTDVAAFDSSTGGILLGKSLSTPGDLVDGVLAAIEASGGEIGSAASLIHGSTVVINALVERRGARTALLTTEGARDVYEIGRINRPQSFNLFFRKHEPLVPRDRVYEVPERLLADGSVRTELSAPAASELARRLAADPELEAVAVLLLHSYRNPVHERLLRTIIEQEAPHLFVTVSHELTREYREFERTSTVVANAYVGPPVRRYLEELSVRLEAAGFAHEVLIMQSNGGVSDIENARHHCVQMVESGPAGGVAGTIALCAALGLERAIAFDMGGTTAKACVVQDRAARLAPEYYVGGYDEGQPIRVPVLDIHEVGTGGGSIAYVDVGGGLRVGPRSAGADPGPVAYARGGAAPTVTDAQVALGRLGAEVFRSGGIQLDPERATAAIAAQIGKPLGLDAHDAALGIVAVANAAMANAVRAVTIERGLDPRDFALVAYGGAGPLHAVDVAQELAVTRVVIPFAPGHFSAFGMLMADHRRDFVQTHFATVSDDELARVGDVYRELEQQGVAHLERVGIPRERIVLERTADMRYLGQEHTVSVAVPATLTARGTSDRLTASFHARHLEEYRHQAEDQAVEIVSVRVSAIGQVDKPHWPELGEDSRAPGAERRRRVWFPLFGPLDTPVVVRSDLRPGERRSGPLIVEEAGSVTCVPPSADLTVDSHGNLLIRC